MFNDHLKRALDNEMQGPEDTITDLCRHWESYHAWLSGPECSSMSDAEYARHIDALTDLEYRITQRKSVTSKELARQLTVATCNWRDDAAQETVLELVMRASGTEQRELAA